MSRIFFAVAILGKNKAACVVNFLRELKEKTKGSCRNRERNHCWGSEGILFCPYDQLENCFESGG